LHAGSSNEGGAEPSNFGDQFDQTSFQSVFTVSTVFDEPDAAGQTDGE